MAIAPTGTTVTLNQCHIRHRIPQSNSHIKYHKRRRKSTHRTSHDLPDAKFPSQNIKFPTRNYRNHYPIPHAAPRATIPLTQQMPPHQELQRPSFNMQGFTRIYCSPHKTANTPPGTTAYPQSISNPPPGIYGAPPSISNSPPGSTVHFNEYQIQYHVQQFPSQNIVYPARS